MHVVLGQVFDTHRLKSARSHMERHVFNIYALGLQTIQEIIGKVKPCRRRRHGTGMTCIDRLVAAFIGFFRRMFDIGRQRHTAESFKHLQNRFGKLQLKKFTGPTRDLDFSFEVSAGGGKEEFRARLRALACADHRDGGELTRHALNERLDSSSRSLGAKKPRFNHAGIVGNEEIAGAKEFFDIPKSTVFNDLFGNMKQPRSGAICQRILGNEFRRKLEIEI